MKASKTGFRSYQGEVSLKNIPCSQKRPALIGRKNELFLELIEALKTCNTENDTQNNELKRLKGNAKMIESACHSY